MKKIAIDLSWVHPGKTGGTESFVRNLLTGIGKLGSRNYKILLLLALDNYDSFIEYKKYPCYSLLKCRTVSKSLWKRVLWQNAGMGRLLKKLGVEVCLEPVYGKPFWGTKGIDFYTVIHDLQAAHFPEYFSVPRVLWMKAMWWNALHTSKKVIAISDFVKQDILVHFRTDPEKITVIYNSIDIKRSISSRCSAEDVLKRYGLKEKRFYYTVSSLLPHKNLKTLILAVKKLEQRPEFFMPLVITGTGGKSRTELDEMIEENGLGQHIIFTGFISNEERDILYRCCHSFLFPSIFEGFGMPPVEAMGMGTPVLAAKCASIEEVTGRLLNYVEHPMDAEEWADRLCTGLKVPDERDVRKLLQRYAGTAAARQYMELLCADEIESGIHRR